MKTYFLVGMFTAITVGAVRADVKEDEAFFEQSVAPLITARCTGCHNKSDRKGGLDLTTRETLVAGGESGVVLKPGDPTASLLWQRVVDKEMPPKEPLPEREQQLLQDWIRRGAPWRGGALDPFRYTTATRAGYDWWSLQPLKTGLLPKFSESGPELTIANPIDLFIIDKLKASNLATAPAADRRTLIRRLYFDLLGMPPDPTEVVAFENDLSPAAYERLVDRLLASPAYGERWARHWLDVVRFGESQGFERDKLRSNSWRYRDWVIDTWNQDLPYNESVRMQLAGEVLRPGDSQALIATGFLVAGPYDEVGQKQQSAAMRAVVREDELEDLVSTIGQTFLGLTVNCSRCHDHKFDPILQVEYYRLAAAVAGVHHGEPELPNAAATHGLNAWSSSVAARIRNLEHALDEIENPPRERLLSQRRAQRAKLSPPKPLAAWEFNDDARDTYGNLHGELRDGAKLDDGKLVLEGKGYVTTPTLQKDLQEKTLEAWVLITDLQQQGGGVLGIQTPDGQLFDSIVYGEREPRRWLAGSNGFERTQSFQGTEEKESPQQPIHVAIVYRTDGTIVGYRNGVRYGTEYKSKGLPTFSGEKAQVIFGLRHSPPGGNRLLRGSIDRARLYDRALTDDEVAASAGSENNYVSESELVAELSETQRSERANLRFELDQLRQQKSRLAETKVYAVSPKKPEPTHVLVRGDPAQKAELVSAGGTAALRETQSDFGLPTDSSDSDRRRKLAEWITDEHNPLFARVIVNRLWHYHFGTGIVETPNDFGFNGGRPSHPELLDWLAAELIRSGWSLKQLQRLLVTSATYRQSSQIRPDAMQLDAANRLLWRKTPQRLEAETLRDTLLAVAGQLNANLHGPGFYDFRTFVSNSQFYELRDPVGTSFQRRSIYRTWVRSGRSPFLDVFDCPDPSTKTPQRAVTTTPLQALSLLNNSFVLRMADCWGDRVVATAGDDVSRQVQESFRMAFGRLPAPDEGARCEELVRQHGLSSLCRVLFNSNELLYVD
jgi:hypothetical protein